MFENLRHRSTRSTSLLDIISEVRRRWRFKLAMRGLVCVAGIAFALFLLAAFGLESARFSPTSILAGRVVLAVALVAAGFWFLVRPLRRRVTDEQVALYLEEHEPSLQETLLSAVEASRSGTPESSALVQRVIQQAIERCETLDAPRRLERLPMRRYTTALALVAGVALLAVLVGPAFIRNAMSALFMLAPDIQAAAPYRIEVTPGSVNIGKGADQLVSATLVGFASEDAVIMARRTPTEKFEAIQLVPTDKGTHDGMLFDVMDPLEYYVEADGVRSDTFTLTVVETPYVQRMEIQYHFPPYTGLEPQTFEDGGDIAAIRGTEIRVRVFPTMKTPAGRLTLDGKEQLPLAPQPDGSLTGAFKVERDGGYFVELVAPTGEHVTASTEYTIDVLADQPPAVSFRRPGRDTNVSPIEEVFIEAKAEDDFGVRDLELVYSVNGAPEKVVKLFEGRAKSLQDVTAGHTLYLEELGLQVGDSVSYYARATDNDAAGGAKRATSDLYFLSVRPFNRDFRQAQSQGGGGGGGGGGGNQMTALSEQQKEIISATHNVNRDRRTYSAEKLRENSNVVARMQARLREQLETMITRMNSELVQRDPAMQKIGEMLPQAAAAMTDAEKKLTALTPDQALPPENRALQILQKAELEFQTQIAVSRGQQGGGGGGGGSQQSQELAELFDQQLEELAPRYETANQGQSGEGGERQVDELLEKLKEIARRQQQEAERQRRRALENQLGGGGTSGAQQRELAEQLEQTARRLERLAREQQRQDLAEAARQAQQTADQMRRAAAAGGQGSAQAQAAAEQLNELNRRLQRNQTARLQDQLNDARRQAEQLARQQRQIAEQTQQLQGNSASARQQQAKQIGEQRSQLGQNIGELERQIDRAAANASQEERGAARRAREASDTLRENQAQRMAELARDALVRNQTDRMLSQIQGVDNQIADALDEVQRQLDEAVSATGQGIDPNATTQEQALERLRNLARGAESQQARTRERLQGNREGQQGQQGREGQQGQQGQQGERGEQGEQGENGQQGQRGQGQDGQQASSGQGGRGQEGQQGQQGQGQGRGEGQQGQGQGEGQGQGQRGQDGQQGGGNGGGRADGRLGDGQFGGRLGNLAGIDQGGYRGGDLGWGGWWNGEPLSPEDIRQFSGEVRQWVNEAQQLRRDLRGVEGIDIRELDRILGELKQLQDPRVYQDVRELVRRQAAVTEQLKRFEYAVRRQVDDQNAIALSGADEVPEEHKPLVEEYFRSLARSK